MGGNYERGIYNHLMDVMSRLEKVEAELYWSPNSGPPEVIRGRAKIERRRE